MSEEFKSVSPDDIANFLEGKLSKKEEKEILIKVNTVEDLWVLAQMKKRVG